MLGVPLHGNDVAPRFCSADRFMLAELDGDRPRRVLRLSLPEEAWSERLECLSAAGVRVLLCGGFNRSFLPLAESFGIRVIFGLAGEAERLIDAFLSNDIERHRLLPCRGGRGRRSGKGRASRRHEAALRRETLRQEKE
jgi:hypothetical protein